MTPPPRSSSLALLLVPLALLLGLLTPVSPATAASSYLCTGYDSCRTKGYAHFGYKQNNHRMYWRMYSGHNCTNYVAYRLVRGGMANDRPWSGSGNASNWGAAKRGITDSTPMVGAVAWWRANVPGAGSAGHVAYVEKVVSKRKIVVSEDSWGGDFHWRTITKAGRGWPSGFIHFDDREVRATSAPAVVGGPVIGTPVRVDTGAWTPTATTALQWFSGSKPIAGATGETFTPTVAQRHKRLSVRVTATARGYSPGTSTTARTAAVKRGTMARGEAPGLTGTARVDEVLVLRPGTLTPQPTSRQFRWFADGKRIAGAAGSRLRLSQAHIRSRITAQVVSKRAGYRARVVATGATPRVKAGRFEVAKPFALPGKPRLGRTLEVQPGSFTPADATVTYTWLRAGKAIPKATGPSYVAGTDDVGKRLSVRVGLERSGYLDHTVTVPAAGPVVTPSDLSLTVKGRPRRAVAVLRVSAEGVSRPRGQALVRSGRTKVTRQVVNGRLRVVLKGLAPGRRTVKAVYRGTGVVLGDRARTTVRVPRR